MGLRTDLFTSELSVGSFWACNASRDNRREREGSGCLHFILRVFCHTVDFMFSVTLRKK